MRFTHENRFIIGLLGLMGFVDAVAPHYQYIHFFNAIMIVWVFYEDLVTLIRNNNVKATFLSTFIGLALYLNVYAVVVTNFRDVGWDIALLLGIIDGLAVNFYSLKS
jgi:uncharacterized membrane protein YhaH (DUF805 family)